MSKPKLKPCPFCGGEATVERLQGWCVSCDNVACEIGPASVGFFTKEDQCRQKLRELAAIPRKITADDVISTFRQEIQDARNAGASWETISKVLKECGYNVGDSTLARKMRGLSGSKDE